MNSTNTNKYYVLHLPCIGYWSEAANDWVPAIKDATHFTEEETELLGWDDPSERWVLITVTL